MNCLKIHQIQNARCTIGQGCCIPEVIMDSSVHNDSGDREVVAEVENSISRIDCNNKHK